MPLNFPLLTLFEAGWPGRGDLWSASGSVCLDGDLFSLPAALQIKLHFPKICSLSTARMRWCRLLPSSLLSSSVQPWRLESQPAPDFLIFISCSFQIAPSAASQPSRFRVAPRRRPISGGSNSQALPVGNHSPVKRAIISDIHGNLEALTATLDHIRTLRVDQIICLGDIIGYGPDPIACLDLVMSSCQLTILGNHDSAAVCSAQGFNEAAEKAIDWTREELERDGRNTELYTRRWDFLGELPTRHDEGQFLFVHGSPRDATNEYVFPEHIFDRERMAMLMQKFEKYCFQGHTHIPGVFTQGGKFLSPDQISYEYELDGREKAMINVGSVGQPRDEDPRACFVLLDTDAKRIKFHRVEYDAAKTRQKIYAIGQLANYLGDRLLTGR